MAEGRPTFHHLSDSQSMKILWLLEELNVDYDLEYHERVASGPKQGRAPEELKQIHPLGKAPQLVLANGRVLIESGVIAEYLIQTYDTKKKFQGDPASGNDKIRNDTLSEFASSSLSLVMIVEMIFGTVVVKTPFLLRFLVRPIHSGIQSFFTGPEFKAFFSYLEKELGEQDYFMGVNPGKADFMLSWPLDFCTQNKFIDLKDYPTLDRYYARCQTREGWKRSRSKGRSYKLSFA